MKLYALTQEQQYIYDLLESGEAVNEDGEVDPVVFEQLKLNGAELKEKALATAIVYKQLMSDYIALWEEEKNLSQRRKRVEKSAEGLKNYLSNCLLTAGLSDEKFSNTKAAISFRKSEAVEIVDESKVPKGFKDCIYKISKERIKEVIKSGLKVRGAILKENKNIQIK